MSIREPSGDISSSSDSEEESSEFNFDGLTFYLKHSWDDLTPESQEEVLQSNIKFRDEFLSISTLFPSNLKPSAESLNILSESLIPQITPTPAKVIKSFIERGLMKKTLDGINYFDCDNFIQMTKEDCIVVISDLAGSGKSFLLNDIHQKLNRKFLNYWVCFVPLLKHRKLLLDNRQTHENFVSFITENILNLNEIERKIFELKYNNDEVVILFDGFDEISPDCKENAMKIFQLHNKTERSQIWITTRTHLEKDLKRELSAEAYKIEPLDEEDQVKFLCKFWKKSCGDSKLRRECAKKLSDSITNNLNKRVFFDEDLIGLTLQLQLLGEYFKDKLHKDFDAKLKSLSFSKIYEFLIEKSVNIKDKTSRYNLLTLTLNVYEVLALKQYLNDENHHLFGKSAVIEDLEDKFLEELARCGIISYDEDHEISFTHLTFLEYFIWSFMSRRIRKFKKKWKYEEEFFELLVKILKSKITRLDESFKDLSKIFDKKSQKYFQSLKNFAESFHHFVVRKENLKDIAEIFESEISHSTIFIVKSISFESSETLKEILAEKYVLEEYTTSYFSFFLQNVRDPELCGEFLDVVFQGFPENSDLFDFLIKTNEKRGETIFFDITKEYFFKAEIFHKVWAKIEERNFEYEKLFKIFQIENKFKRNFLSAAITLDTSKQEQEILCEVLKEIKKLMQRILKIEDQKKILRGVKLFYCQDEKLLNEYLKFLKEIFNPEEIVDYFENMDEGQTILNLLTYVSSLEIIKIIFKELKEMKKENFDQFIKKFILLPDKYGFNILMLSAKDPQKFYFMFDEIFRKFLPFKEFLYKVCDNGSTILHYLIEWGTFEMLDHFIKRAELELSEEEFKSFCTLKTKKRDTIFPYNCFRIMATKEKFNDEEVRKLNYFVSKFTKEEMKEILSELEGGNRLLLHFAARREKTFPVFYDLYEKHFTSKEILHFFNIKTAWGRNVIQLSRNSEYAKDIFKKLEESAK